MNYSTLICFVRSVPLLQSLSTVDFAGNSFYSICSVQLYISVLEYSNHMWNCLLRLLSVFSELSTVHFCTRCSDFLKLCQGQTQLDICRILASH